MADEIPVPLPTPKDWARFMAKVAIQPDGCWQWTGAKFSAGYGMFGLAGKARRAHRVIYVWLYGEIADGLNLDHCCHSESIDCAGGPTCMHRGCVNPNHLEPKTHKANTAGTAFARATHCKNGHPWDDANTHRTAIQRSCRACAAGRAKAKFRVENPNAWKPELGLCHKGHSFDALDSKGHRTCSTCRRERRRERYLITGM